MLEKSRRSSNYELLRILCMTFIVMHHFVVHGGSFEMDGLSTNRIISLIILPLGKISFNCFVALSTWFLAESSFKASRFLKIWLEVLFYNIVFMVLTDIFRGGYVNGITWRNWLGAILPMCGNSHGYAAAYMAFYLMLPFLRIVSDAINKTQLIYLISILSVTQFGVILIGRVIQYTQPFASEILLFVLCYYISSYLRRYPSKWQSNRWILAGVLISLWLVTALFHIWNAVQPEAYLAKYFCFTVTVSELSYVNTIAGYALFLLFGTIEIPTSRTVNAVASTMFGVLLAHDHNYFRPILWKRFLKTDQWYYVPTVQFVGGMIAATVLIMTAGMVIDALRQTLLEKPIMKSKPIAMATALIDRCVSSNQ